MVVEIEYMNQQFSSYYHVVFIFAMVQQIEIMIHLSFISSLNRLSES